MIQSVVHSRKNLRYQDNCRVLLCYACLCSIHTVDMDLPSESGSIGRRKHYFMPLPTLLYQVVFNFLTLFP